MSRRYALLEHSGDVKFPDSEVEITKNFRKAVEWFKARKGCARVHKFTEVPYTRVVYEMPVTWKPPRQSECEIMAMHVTSTDRPVSWKDILAHECVQWGRVVDLSNYV